MNSAEQVLFILQLILVLGPLAVYFLGLGLVNSLAQPCLVNARTDFVVLTVAFVPVIVAPLVFLVQHEHAAWALFVVAVVGLLFWLMLPASRTRWVIYNCSLQQFRRLVTQTSRRLGCTATYAEDHVRIGPAGLHLHLNAIPLLRNVTLRWIAVPDERTRQEFLRVLGEEMAGEAMLPSPAGASLVVIGAALLGVPMWFLLHHINAIVDVVRQILFA